MNFNINNKDKDKDKDNVVLPWRDSKLTMMLKKCMDGNS